MIEQDPAYEVRVTFRGLCSFVPGAELGETQKWVGAFLVNASEINQGPPFNVDRPVHFPFLRFRASDLEQGHPGEEVMVRLSSEDIIFVPPEGSPRGLTVRFSGKVGEEPKNEDEEEFFDWLCRVEEVMPGRGKVHPDCFTPHPREGRVVARVHIVRGVLRADDIARYANERVLVRINGAKRQVVAKSVRLTIPCAAGRFVIRARRYGASATRDIVLRQPKDSNHINIGIVNLCEDNLLSIEQRPVFKAFQKDHDFRWVYLLSDDTVNDLRGGEVPNPILLDYRTLKAIAKKKMREEERSLRALIVGEGVVEASTTIIDDSSGGGPDGAQCSPPIQQVAPQASVGEMMGIVSSLEE